MRIFKRAVAVLLAVLMILSSMSAFASLNDGKMRTMTSQVRFYRYDELTDSYVETIKVAPGDKVEARIILQSDFIVGSNFLYYLYNSDVFEVDTEEAGDSGSAIDSYDTEQRSGLFTYDEDNSGFNTELIDNGYIDSSVYDHYSSVYFYARSGLSSIFDGTTEVYTAHFKVKEDATIGSTGSMFIPVETVQHKKTEDTKFLSQPTYAAKVRSADDVGLDIGTVDTDTSESWEYAFEVDNLVSTNLSTVAAAQGFSDADVTAGSTISYNGTTTQSSFVTVTNNVNVTYYVLNEDNTYLTDDEGDPVIVTWQTSDDYASGKSSGKTYYYNFNSYSEISATCLEGLTPTVPTSRGFLQNIPEGYYFAGWMPVDWDDGVDVTRADALDYMTNVPSVSDTVTGTVYEWPTATSTSAKNTSKTYTDSYDGLVADPNAATMKAITSDNYGSYLYTGDDDAYYLDLIAVILPVPTDVTVRDISVPGGSTLTGSTFQVGYGSDITEADVDAALTSAPAAVEGYTFSWYVDDEDGNTTALEFPYTVTGATTIIGEYEKNTYSVSYMNGETEIESFDVIFEDEIEVTATEPTKAGYDFTGWLDADGNAPEDYDSMPAKNLVFNAQFNAANQTITYYLDNAATGETTTAATDSTFTLAAKPVKAGYTVSEWVLKDADGNVYTGTTMPAGGLNAYATSTADAQPITYKVDGVETALTPDSALTDAAVTLADLPVKAGYTYSAWTLEDGSAVPANMPAGGITVVTTSTAVAQPITYKVDGVETALTPDSALTDAAVTLADLPVKAGYSYSAWTLEDGSAVPANMPAGGITVITVSTALDQDLEYYVDGTLTKTDKVATDADYTLDAVPVKAGYSYTAWKLADGTDAVNGAMPAGGIKVYTTSTALDQDLEYYVDGVKDETLSTSVKTDADYTLAAIPTKAGYTYTAWKVSVDADAADAATSGTMPAGGIRVYTTGTADAQPITYKVDGVVTALTPAAADTDAAITLADLPVKAGYTYSAWTLEDGSAIPAAMPAGGITVVTYSTATEQTITYKVAGEADKVETYATDATVTAYAPAKAGYTFDGWYTDDAYTTAATVPTVMPAADVVLYGRYIADAQPITYKVDGTVTELTPNTAETDGSIVLAAKPEKAGYSYTDWTLEDGSAVPSTMPAGGITVVSNGTALPQTITYIVDGDSTPYHTDTFNTDETIVRYADPSKAGYTFHGWYSDAAYENAYTFGTMPAGGVTVYGYFTADTQSIIYVVDKAVTALEPSTANTDDALTLAALPVKAGYSYSAWTLEDGSAVPATMPAHSITVVTTSTALDQPITYKVDGVETALEPSSAKTDAAFTLAAKPAKDGYSYTAWTLEDGSDIPAVMPAGGITVVSTSTALDQDLEYYVDGTLTKTVQVKTDADYTLDAVPSKAGYSYTAWKLADDTDAAVSGTMPYGGIKVYTTSTALDQNLEYYVDGTLTKTVQVKTDADYTLDAVPTKAGYEYTEWKLADDSAAATTGTMPAGGIKVYTTSAALDQNLNYYVNGELTKTVKVKTDADYTLDAVPTKAGYTYTAWKNADDTDAATSGTMPAGGINVYTTSTADMQPITYKVDGEVVTLTPDEAATNAEVVLAAKPSKAGYTYTDWTLEDGSAVPGTMPVGGITVVSTGTADDQLITYKVDGKEVSLTPNTYKTDETITLAAKPSKTGYTYSDWTLEDGSAVPAVMPAGGITVVSDATVNQYTVTIRNEDNTEISSASLDYGTAITFPTAAEMKVDAYNFLGWNGDDGSAVAPDGSATVPAYNITYTAQYNQTPYTVTIRLEKLDGTYEETTETRYAATSDVVDATEADKTATGFVYSEADSDPEAVVAADGNTNLIVTLKRAEYKLYTVVDGGAAEEAAAFRYGETLAEVTAPTKTGYTFHGWYSDADCTEAFDFTQTMPADNLTAYGKFTINDYTITYVTDGSAVEPATVTYGAAIPSASSSKTGYYFLGWTYTDADGNEYTGTSMPANDLTATAKFQVATYTINYYVDGAIEESISLTYGSAISYSGIYTAEAGMKLDGWYTDADCTDNAVPANMPAQNVNVYAKTEIDNADTRTITFKDADGNVIGTQEVTVGTVIVPATAVPEKSGYTNGRWEYNDAAVSGITMPDEDITVVAAYDPLSYTITYVSEGTTVETFTADYGDTVDETATEPAKAGYIFTGWLDDSGNAPEDYASMPAQNLTFTAQFEAADQPITYKADGVVLTADAYKDQTAKTDAAVTLADLPVKAGYTYSAWTLEDGSAVPANMPAGGITVVTYSTATEQTITYYVDGTAEHEDTYATDATVTAYEPAARTGYTFDGWYTDNTYATAATVPEIMGAEDVTLYGKYDINSYTITYMNGDEVVETFTVNYNDDIEETATEPVKANAVFTGWLDADSKAPSDYSAMPANDLTFYAQFENDVTFTFDPNGGEWADGTISAKEATVHYNEGIDEAVAALAEEPVKTGSTFDGWVVAEGNNYEAKWVAIDYTITYNNEDGTEVVAFTGMHYGDAVKVTADITKAGYKFDGWFDAEGKTPDDYEKMPAKNLVFTAKFTAELQPITYKVDGVVTELEPSSALTDSEFTLAPVPTKATFEYSAWTLEDGSPVPATMPAGGITVVSDSTRLTATIIFDANGGQFSDGSLTMEETVDAQEAPEDEQEAAVAKLPEDPTRYGYVFEGWQPSATEESTMVAQWKEIVKLVPVNSDSTAMIERDGIVETYNTFAADATLPYGIEAGNIIAPNPEAYTAADYDSWYVYGLSSNITVADLAGYVKVTGDGKYDVYDLTGAEAEDDENIGTGYVIKVTDNETGAVVEEFYIVIFGDIDGNGIINGNDTSRVYSEVKKRSWSIEDGTDYKGYLVKAGDLDLNGIINGNDDSRLTSVTYKKADINQTTGLSQ